jgi:hypothetical protein
MVAVSAGDRKLTYRPGFRHSMEDESFTCRIRWNPYVDVLDLWTGL